MIRVIYSVVFYLVLPLILFRVFWRAQKEPRYKEDLSQRLGFIPKIESGAIWVHSVSAGETIAATNLVKRLLASGERVVISNMTPTGRERAEALFGADSRVSIVYAPYDLFYGVKRFFARLQPKALLVVDTELWPNMIAIAKTLSVPVFVVNGRLSEKSANGYSKISWLSEPMFKALDCVFAQSDAQSRRFTELGSQTVRTSGSIKFDAVLPADFNDRRDELGGFFESRIVLLAASTHEGEESVFVDAFLQFARSEHVLVIAPRHTHRVSQVETLLRRKDLSYQLHSKGESLDSDTQVYLVDTMGELMYFYGVCQSAFVGGSLVNVGGHNPMEPAQLGKPIMMGPYRRNIVDIAELFSEAGALREVSDARSVLRFWQETQVASYRETMSNSSLKVMESNRGALDRILDEVSSRLRA